MKIKLDIDAMPLADRKKLWGWTLKQIGGRKATVRDLENEIVRHKVNIKMLESIKKACLPRKCKSCGGYGSTREWIASDECVTHPCEPCKGTGETEGS